MNNTPPPPRTEDKKFLVIVMPKGKGNSILVNREEFTYTMYNEEKMSFHKFVYSGGFIMQRILIWFQGNASSFFANALDNLLEHNQEINIIGITGGI